MTINNNILSLAIIFASAITLSGTASALPAGTDQLRIQTSNAKKNDETAFSYLVEWRKGEEIPHRANGLTFVHGPDRKKPTTAVEAARKFAKSLDKAMSYESPKDRGAKAIAPKGKPEFTIRNNETYDFNRVTIRDYSNQELSFNLPGKSFSTASVDVAIDIVYAAAVEYMEGFSIGKEEKTKGGYVRVSIDGGKPIEIKTNGKTNVEIENELAKALGPKASFSKTPIYPNYREAGSRNYKEFDGGEVQLKGLNAKSITVDIYDAGLGALTKFDFPDVHKPADVASKIPYIVGLLVFGIVGYVGYTNYKNKEKEEA